MARRPKTKKKKFETTGRSAPARSGGLFAIPVLPPGIVVDQYELIDVRDYDALTEAGEKKHVMQVWTTLRDKLIDQWLDDERILRTACVLLLSPTDELQSRVWDLMVRQNGDALIDLLGDLLVTKGHDLPKDFRVNLKALVRHRNLLAHQPSRPSESKISDGLVFLRSTGFKKGVYVEVSYQDIDQVLSDIRPVMAWLIAEVPDADGVIVDVEDEVFDFLERRGSPPK